MSVVLGGAAAAVGQEQQGDQGLDSGAVSPKPHLDDMLSMLECGLQLPQCLSARGNKTQGAGTDVEAAAEQQQQPALSHAASGCLFSMADLETSAPDWEGDMFLPLPPSASPQPLAVSMCEAGQPQQQLQEQHQHHSQQQQDQQSISSDAEVRSSMLEVLLQQFRWSSVAAAAAAAASTQPGNSTSAAGSLGEDGLICGVCLDAVPTACILPCKHNMCGESSVA
jgi:hypothetical protein